MLIGVLGDLGSGKTLLLAIWGYKLGFKTDKYDVYANFHIYDSNVEYLTPKKLLDINPIQKRAVVLLDEVYAWLDSRVSGSKINRILSWVVLQSRKRNMDIIYSAQIGSSADLRLRDTTQLIVFCEAVGNPFDPDGFYYVVEWNRGIRILHRNFYLPKKVAQKYYKIYDTREIVKPIGFEKLRKSLED